MHLRTQVSGGPQSIGCIQYRRSHIRTLPRRDQFTLDRNACAHRYCHALAYTGFRRPVHVDTVSDSLATYRTRDVQTNLLSTGKLAQTDIAMYSHTQVSGGLYGIQYPIHMSYTEHSSGTQVLLGFPSQTLPSLFHVVGKPIPKAQTCLSRRQP